MNVIKMLKSSVADPDPTETYKHKFEFFSFIN